MQALVTGALGFVGVHLCRHLLEQGHSVGGLVLPTEVRSCSGALPPQVEVFGADILEGEAVVRILQSWKPTAIYHLAAFSNPESSWAQAERTLETNILGSHNLLQAAVEIGIEPRVLLVGSCQQYGLVPEKDQPIREEQPQRPLTPYAVSKASQEILGQRFFLSGLLPVLLVRAFNHTGPGQSASYVCSSFARQIVEIEAGCLPPRIKVGNLTVRRDFTDVRDVVRAYTFILERGNPGEPYNVCRGEALSVRQLLDAMLELTEVDVAAEVETNRYHALDVPLMLGDNSRLSCELGWQPHFGLKQTLADLLDTWREKVS